MFNKNTPAKTSDKAKRSKAGKIIAATAWVLIGLMAVLLVYMLGMKLAGRVPMVFGRSVLKIVSGSMEDTIPTGSYILIESVDTDDIAVNDVIVFYMRTGELAGSPNTHRVIEIIENDGVRSFRTKGDNNLAADGERVTEENVIGRYVKNITWLNGIGDFFANPAVFLVLILGPATFLVVVEIINVAKTAKKVKRESDGDAVSREEELKRLAVEEYIAAHSEHTDGKGTENDGEKGNNPGP